LFRTKSIFIGKLVTEASGTDQARLKIPEVLCVYETDFSVYLLSQLTKHRSKTRHKKNYKIF